MRKELVSIIIRTKNEEKWISSCLRSVFDQSYKNFEVIIVDNQSTDNTVARAKEFNVKIISINEFYPGKAINKGVRNSNGEIIVCLSGHCIPTNNDWLKNLISNLSNGIAGVYGRQEPLSFSSDLDKRDLIIVFGKDKKIQIKDSFFHNANSAFTRKIWEKYPFSETLSNIEDRIWGQEVIEAKLKIIYEPDASVYHWHGIHQESDLIRAKNIVKILENIDDLKPKDVPFSDQRILAVIPLRGPTLSINNIQLLEKTITEIRKSNLITDIAVSTDNSENIKIANKQNVITIKRPNLLSEDFVDILDVVEFSLDKIEETREAYDLVITIEEIFPFRRYETIDEMIKKSVSNGFATILAGKVLNHSIWEFDDVSGNFLNTNKDINISFPSKLRKHKKFIGLPGFCSVIHTSSLRNKHTSGIVGIHEIKNQKETIEIKNNNDISFLKLIMENEIANE